MSIKSAIAMRMAGFVMPAWAPWAAAALAVAMSYGAGRLHEARIGAAALVKYQQAQVAQTVRIIEKQVEVQTVVQTKYVDRIKKIYVQGEVIEKHIPTYITPADVARFGVNAGFVRIHAAAWSGQAIGPAIESDREPASVSLAQIATVEAGNAISCRVWREKVLGWREFYAKQQVAINGKAGDWAAAAPPELIEE